MIVIETVRWKNFLATGREWIEIALNNHKSTLFIGINGAGKSTLLDAISFVLFNKPFREVNKGLVLNSITKKDCVVEIEFNINGRKYLVRRGIKPNIFEIFVDGVEVPSEANATDFQAYLEKQILRMNYKAFTQVVMLGSALFVPFMKLKAAQRREVVEDLLDLQIFTKMNVILKGDVQQIDLDIAKAKADIQTLKQTLSYIEQSNKALRQNNDAQIAERLEIIARQQSVCEREQQRIDERQAQLDAMPDLDPLPIIQKRQKLHDVKITFEIEIETIDREVRFFNDHESCPQCSQSIEADHAQHLCSEKLKRRKQLAEGLAELTSKMTAYSEQMQAAADNQAARKKISDQIIISQGQIQNDLRLTQQYNRDIENLRKAPATEQDTSSVEAALVGTEAQLENLEHEKRVAAYGLVLLKDGGIKSQVIKQYVPIFNQLINQYLSSLDFFVDFNLDENFNETIRSRYRDEFVYNLFSEGQKMRIDLALMFTWRAIARQRSSIDINILIMDEVFDSSLDDAGTDELLLLIRKLTTEDNVIVISHKGDRMVDKFDRTLQFSLVKNFTQMEQLA